MAKLNFQHLQSSASHDPSEIILIFSFGAYLNSSYYTFRKKVRKLSLDNFCPF